MGSPLTAIGPRLSQAAMERLSYEIFRPKAKDDAPGVDADRATSTANASAGAASVNEELLSALPGSRFEALVESLTAPDVWPRFVKDQEDMPGVGFPKGVPVSVVEGKRETAQKQYEDAREAQRKAQEEDRKAQEEAQREAQRAQEGGGDDPDKPDMPNPDSGDPGGPRSIDPYLYQPQPVMVKTIADIAIR